jgi:Leucine-rich repeat (LRR) protein
VNCTNLEELDAGDQAIDSLFDIEEHSIIAISRTLTKLRLNRCQVAQIGHLEYCDRLEDLDLSENRIQFSENLFKAIT